MIDDERVRSVIIIIVIFLTYMTIEGIIVSKTLL